MEERPMTATQAGPESGGVSRGPIHVGVTFLVFGFGRSALSTDHTSRGPHKSPQTPDHRPSHARNQKRQGHDHKKPRQNKYLAV